MNSENLRCCARKYEFFSPYLRTCSRQTYSCTYQNSSYQRLSKQSRSALCPIWTLFSMPKVHAAEVATATDCIEQAEHKLVSSSSHFITELEVQEVLASETGRDRVRQMFSKNHLGQISTECHFIYQVTLQAAAITFLVTSVLSGRQAKEEFIEQHRASVYKTRFMAFRHLQDAIFMKSVKEGCKWAFKISLFSSSFLGVSQIIAVYRNKTSPLEYSAAGAVTGAFMKVNLGLKGMIAGSVFGSAMGFGAGILIWGAMHLLNETQEQRHTWQIQKRLEDEKINKGLAPPQKPDDVSYKAEACV